MLAFQKLPAINTTCLLWTSKTSHCPLLPLQTWRSFKPYSKSSRSPTCREDMEPHLFPPTSSKLSPSVCMTHLYQNSRPIATTPTTDGSRPSTEWTLNITNEHATRIHFAVKTESKAQPKPTPVTFIWKSPSFNTQRVLLKMRRSAGRLIFKNPDAIIQQNCFSFVLDHSFDAVEKKREFFKNFDVLVDRATHLSGQDATISVYLLTLHNTRHIRSQSHSRDLSKNQIWS